LNKDDDIATHREDGPLGNKTKQQQTRAENMSMRVDFFSLSLSQHADILILSLSLLSAFIAFLRLLLNDDDDVAAHREDGLIGNDRK